MKYLKKFQTNADYQTFKASSNWVTPNVSLIEENVSGNDFNIVFEPFVSNDESGGKIVNHGVITLQGNMYYLTFEFPIACEYMTVDCLPQYFELYKGSYKTSSMAPAVEGLGDTIKIYASNNGYDDYSSTNEDDTYIYKVNIAI